MTFLCLLSCFKKIIFIFLVDSIQSGTSAMSEEIKKVINGMQIAPPLEHSLQIHRNFFYKF